MQYDSYFFSYIIIFHILVLLLSKCGRCFPFKSELIVKLYQSLNDVEVDVRFYISYSKLFRKSLSVIITHRSNDFNIKPQSLYVM